ncbi:hypothetical protein ABK040_011665 [Willaertia magna]
MSVNKKRSSSFCFYFIALLSVLISMMLTLAYEEFYIYFVQFVLFCWSFFLPPAVIPNAKCQSIKTHVKPVILLGGVGGSVLYATRNNSNFNSMFCAKTTKYPYQVWVPLWGIIHQHCLRNDLKLKIKEDPNGDGFVVHQHDENVRVFPMNIGSVKNVEVLAEFPLFTYMTGLIDYLVKEACYERDKTIRAFPYDFRLSPKEWSATNRSIGGDYERFKVLIEETFKLNDNKKVSLVSQSLGSPFTQYFLAHYVTQEWKDKYIDRFISISGAFDGTIYSKIALIQGIIFELDVFDKRATVEMISTWPSAYSTFVQKEYDFPFFIYNGKEYFTSNYEEFFKDLDLKDAYKLLQHIRVKDRYKAPNVTTHCITGFGFETPLQFYYNGTKPLKDLDITDFKLTKFVDGDTTIPTEALDICHNFKQDYPVLSHRFEKGPHRAIIKAERLFKLSPIYFEQDNNIPPNIAFMMGFLLAAHIFLNKLCSKYSDVYRYIEERKKKQFVAFWIEGFYKLIAVPFFLWFVIVAFDDSNDPTNLVSECQVITIFFEITVSMNSYQLLYCNYPDDLNVFTIGATLGALYNPDSYFYGSLMLTIDITFPFIPVINTLNIYGYKNSYLLTNGFPTTIGQSMNTL